MKFEVFEVENEIFGGSDYKLRCTRSDGESCSVYTFDSYQYPSRDEIERAKREVIEDHPQWVFTDDEMKSSLEKFYQDRYNHLQSEIAKVLATALSLGLDIEVS